jgi:hypothetical protein
VANYDDAATERLRRKSWYDFNFLILALKKRTEAQEAANSNT